MVWIGGMTWWTGSLSWGSGMRVWGEAGPTKAVVDRMDLVQAGWSWSRSGTSGIVVRIAPSTAGFPLGLRLWISH